MAAKYQLSRAASTLRSASDTCANSVVAIQRLLDSFPPGSHLDLQQGINFGAPEQGGTLQEDQQQHLAKLTQQQLSSCHVLASDAARQAVNAQSKAAGQQQPTRSPAPWHLQEEAAHQQYLRSLTSNPLDPQHARTAHRLCDYKPLPPNRGGSGSVGSQSSSSNASQSDKTASNSSSSASAPSDSLAAALMAIANSSKAAQLTPSAITKQLDKHIVGQAAAKRAVAVALRNRWRRHRLPQHIAEEITPKNILMIGPTGCGKTEIARRLAKLVEAPFIKVEATKFTELGFVGRDVDEIVKDLMEAAITLTRTRLAQQLRDAAAAVVEEILLKALCGPQSQAGTLDSFRKLYRAGVLDEREVEIDLDSITDIAGQLGGPGAAAAMGGFAPGSAAGGSPIGVLASIMEQASKRAMDGGVRSGRGRGKTKTTISEGRKLLLDAEVERFLSSERVVKEALRAAQEDGIVFIDEIDKIVDTSKGAGGATSSNVSSEGVQRDLLPILEGSVVATKYGNVSTEHVLFIASGAFHSSKPGDMLAELQGRLPVKVELAGLTADDFYRILTEPQHNMLRQQQVLLATEGVDLHFSDGAIRAIAKAAEDANKLLDNIGARRLHTVLERVLADISFEAPEKVAAAKRERSSSSSESSSSGSSAAEGQQVSSSSGLNSSSSSSSSSEGELLVHFEVTEDMVEACMKPMLKHIDVSKYML